MGIPLATALSIKTGIPFVVVRKDHMVLKVNVKYINKQVTVKMNYISMEFMKMIIYYL